MNNRILLSFVLKTAIVRSCSTFLPGIDDLKPKDVHVCVFGFRYLN